MKKILINLSIFFHALMRGLKQADKTAFEAQNNSLNDGVGIEQQKEDHNVYKDMLKGEVTQEVKEFRHEMYYAERFSHKYDYAGNGRAKAKANTMFDYSGPLETSDGYKVQLVQENKEEVATLTDYGIMPMGENVDLSPMAQGDLRLKERRDFTIKIERDFIPRFRLEEYTNKLVVKKIDDTKVLLDFYTSIYPKQFDNRHHLFVDELERLKKEGFYRSDIIDITGVHFIAYGAYGSDDLKEYSYNNIEFGLMTTFDGNYVLRFGATIVKDGEDLIAEFYDAKADEKSRNHEARDGQATITLDAALYKKEQESYDVDAASKLMEELEDDKVSD